MLAGQINTLQVPYGQRLKFTLPDGSSVQLNSGARIEYPTVFKKNLRKVKLSGEAVFDVEHDEGSSVRRRNFRIRYSGVGYEIQCNRR